MAAARFELATKGFFSSRCETILENQEKVNRDVGHILAVNIR